MKYLSFLSLLIACLLLSITACSTSKNNFSNNVSAIDFKLVDNRIFVEVSINNNGVYHFIFDTGGANSLTLRAARELGLPLKDIGSATGAGEDSIKLYQTKINNLQLGSIILRNQDFYVMDLSDIEDKMNFERLDGVIGYEFLKNHITSIDYEKHKLRFFSELNRNKLNKYQEFSFELIGNKPVINALINGSSAKVLIDTGDRSALTVFRNFYSTSKFKKLFLNKKIIPTGYGIGGPILAKMCELESLNIGSQIKFEKIITRAPTARKGFNSIPSINASIGNEVMKQLNSVYDYRSKKVYLLPNSNYGKETNFYKVPNLSSN